MEEESEESSGEEKEDDEAQHTLDISAKELQELQATDPTLSDVRIAVKA